MIPENCYAGSLGREILEFARQLSRMTDEIDAHARILRTLARRTEAGIGSIAVYDQKARALAITATYGYSTALVEDVRIEPGQGILGTSFVDGRSELRQVASPRRRRYKTLSYMIVPLLGAAGPLGVIALTDKREAVPFTEEDLSKATVLAAVAELSLARVDALSRLADVTRLAAIDPVTDIYNRRHFETVLEPELQRARRQGEDLALLMIDIDNFKRVNDLLGHQTGDRVLREVAQALRSGVRIFDVCARYGGEEFAIIMPGASRQMAVQVAARIRDSIEGRDARDSLPVTVSIGVGVLGPRDATKDLVASADRALLAAKRAGKNTVTVDRGEEATV